MRPPTVVTVGYVSRVGWCVSVWRRAAKRIKGQTVWVKTLEERYPCPNGHPNEAEKMHLIQFYTEMQQIKRSKQ